LKVDPRAEMAVSAQVSSAALRGGRCGEQQSGSYATNEKSDVRHGDPELGADN
jgi:hypothetical protein